jgi:signal transduction histidine kinase
MNALKKILRGIPYWAYLLVLTGVFVNTIYLVYRYQASVSGETEDLVNGHWIINFIREDGPVGRTEIKVGDTLVSCNGIPLTEWSSRSHETRAGDTAIFGILRNNKEVGIPVIADSKMSVFPGLYWSVYILMLLLSICSLYILYKKPDDKAAGLFFIYIQLSVIAVNAANVTFSNPLFAFTNVAYILSSCLLGPVLIHFHLLFPRPVQLFRRIRIIPLLFYILGVLIFVYTTITYYLRINPFTAVYKIMYNVIINRATLIWLTFTFILAMAIVIYQFLTVKNTLSRNQMLIVFTGSFFGFLTPIGYGLFYDYVNYVLLEDSSLLPLSQAIGSFIMILCILIAIFRYRIWDIEVFIRKALLYLAATFVIILTYLLLIWIVDRSFISGNNLTRFLVLGVSVIIFLVLRDRIQLFIDRIFHRESYDSATVVSDFEAKLAGIYRIDELKQKIVQSLDQIFHFKSFIFILKKNKLIYEPAFVSRIDDRSIGTEYEITRELEEKLGKSKVFSPEELNNKPPLLEVINGELVVPLISEGMPNGFFVCGQKKSERIYSQQDIRVLMLLARRVVALLHTASLYQKDLDRQLMLERERARISQDMHDDIGAGLTKIAMISEAPVKAGGQEQEIRERMARVASSSREMISRLNVIVWALNPKYDNLESLVTYLRRYFGEYLENFGIRIQTDIPEQIPEFAITPDTRRNIFYAVQEAIHNAVKHGACSEISLTMNLHGQNIGITVTDNGKGFENTKTGSGGNGLLNMKKRAEDLGGSFEIQSAPGKGTKILFLFRVARGEAK